MPMNDLEKKMMQLHSDVVFFLKWDAVSHELRWLDDRKNNIPIMRTLIRIMRGLIDCAQNEKCLPYRLNAPSFCTNTPAMPLLDAQIGGFFYARSRWV